MKVWTMALACGLLTGLLVTSTLAQISSSTARSLAQNYLATLKVEGGNLRQAPLDPARSKFHVFQSEKHTLAIHIRSGRFAYFLDGTVSDLNPPTSTYEGLNEATARQIAVKTLQSLDALRDLVPFRAHLETNSRGRKYWNIKYQMKVGEHLGGLVGNCAIAHIDEPTGAIIHLDATHEWQYVDRPVRISSSRAREIAAEILKAPVESLALPTPRLNMDYELRRKTGQQRLILGYNFGRNGWVAVISAETGEVVFRMRSLSLGAAPKRETSKVHSSVLSKVSQFLASAGYDRSEFAQSRSPERGSQIVLLRDRRAKADSSFVFEGHLRSATIQSMSGSVNFPTDQASLERRLRALSVGIDLRQMKVEAIKLRKGAPPLHMFTGTVLANGKVYDILAAFHARTGRLTNWRMTLKR